MLSCNGNGISIFPARPSLEVRRIHEGYSTTIQPGWRTDDDPNELTVAGTISTGKLLVTTQTSPHSILALPWSSVKKNIQTEIL